jgi:hypothetical protein
MSGNPVEKASLVSHPLAVADATGLTNVHRYSLTGAAQSIAIPAGWRGRFCLLTNDSSADIQYCLSVGAAATLVMDQTAAIGTGHAACGSTIFAGTSKDARIRQGASAMWLNVISSVSGGFLEVEISETSS